MGFERLRGARCSTIEELAEWLGVSCSQIEEWRLQSNPLPGHAGNWVLSNVCQWMAKKIASLPVDERSLEDLQKYKAQMELKLIELEVEKKKLEVERLRGELYANG